jgi:hypothetical protein
MTADVSAATGGTGTASTFAQTTVGRTALTCGKYPGVTPAKYLLEYACVTDAAGNITHGDASFRGGEMFQSSTPAFAAGAFFVQDLVGLDAAAVTALGKLESGSVMTPGSVLRIY